jgi:HEPN domain-containing protein
MPPEVREVRLWLEKAAHDRAGAEAAYERIPPVTDVAAFHCQQAIEKMLKACLVYREDRFERTHDLVELLALCARHDQSFQSLRSVVAPLTPYAVRFRYPGPTDPSVEEVREALRVVGEVWQFVTDRLPADVVPGPGE